MDRRRRHTLVAAMISGVASLMWFFGGLLGNYQAGSRSAILLAVIAGIGVIAAVLTGVAAYMLQPDTSSSRFAQNKSRPANTLASQGATRPSLTERNRWEESLGRLCKGQGLRESNQEWIHPEIFQATPAISERVGSLIDRLPSEEDRRIARYCFNVIDDAVVGRLTLVGRQNALADSGGPSRRAVNGRMNSVIIPELARMLAA